MNTEAIIYTAGYFRNTKGASWEGTQLSTTPRSALLQRPVSYLTHDPTRARRERATRCSPASRPSPRGS